MIREQQALEIYKAYPRHIARAVAVRSIAKKLKNGDVPYEKMLARTKEFAELTTRRDVDKMYIPYPSTFFNQERYSDDYDEVFPKPRTAARTTL